MQSSIVLQNTLQNPGTEHPIPRSNLCTVHLPETPKTINRYLKFTSYTAWTVDAQYLADSLTALRRNHTINDPSNLILRAERKLGARQFVLSMFDEDSLCQKPKFIASARQPSEHPRNGRRLAMVSLTMQTRELI